MKLSPDLEKVLNEAVKYALEGHHEYVSLEHILLAMTENEESVEILEGCGADVVELRKTTRTFLTEHCPKIDTTVLTSGEGEWKPSLTLAFHRVVQRALIQVQSADRDMVTPGNLLIALLREEESPAVTFLHNQGITRFDAINYFSHGIPKDEEATGLPSVAPEEEEEPEMPPARPRGKAMPDPDAEPQEEGERPGRKAKGSPLQSFCVNLNERAAKGLIDPLIGREDIIERTIQVLSRRTKNNVILVGEPGVGKTAIADGLALRIIQGKVPAKIKDAVIYSLDLGSLLAGTRYRGDFEARLKSVLKALEEQKQAVLFIDEMHTIVGAGATSGGSMDASNLLKPSLANRSLSVIGSTTYKEFRGYLDKDQALMRRFQKIDVKEPSVDDAIKILEGLASRYEEFHGVKLPPEVLKASVDLSARHIQGRPLPDKAIDVMDEVGARLRLKATSPDLITAQVGDVEAVVSSVAQVPVHSVSASDRERLKNLEPELKAAIFGQDKAIQSLCASIKLARTGLRASNKPIGCYLFTGPTGVGKTEVCKQLALTMGVPLIRFDMSEYMEKHTVSRLVGAPPGYVGFDEGGLLTEAVFKAPYAVLLLDEMEKAHPDIGNILLQVMDSGKLTDTNGKVADFRNVILVMTSNAGAREVAKQSIGIVPQVGGAKSLQAIKNAFSPEFINRLDSIITFDALPEAMLLKVIEKFANELGAQLAEKNVKIELSDAAKHWLYKKGYNPAYGARPFARMIDEHVKKPLVDELLFGKLQNGGRVKVDATSDDAEELKFTYLKPAKS